MRLPTHAAGAILLLGLAAAGFGQSTVPRSGFVIITPVSGNIAGLVASETVINNTSLGIAEAGVSPAPLLTTAVLPVSVGPATQGTSAIAIANPSTSAGQVNIRLTDQQGAQMLNTVFAIGSFQQVSRFLNEFFADQSVLAVRRVALLTVTSTIPVAVFGLDFRSNAFATLPITSLTTPFPVPVQTVTTPVSTFATPTTIFVAPATAATISTFVTPPPATFGVVPPGTPAGMTSPNFGIGVATPTPVQVVTPPVTVVNGTLVATTATTPAFIGGGGALIFPQIASGGGWTTEIVIGNTSSADQIIRIDLFTSDGTNVNSLTSLTIPAGGVVFLSTEPTGGTIF